MILNLSIGQMDVRLGEPEANYERAAIWIEEATRRGSTLVLFPELWTTGYDLANSRIHSTPLGEGMFAPLAALASRYRVAIGGSILEAENSQIYNTFVLYGQNGDLLANYRKVHLFRLMDEDQWLTAGERLELVETEWGMTGLAICYDLRFPEMFRRYTLADARLILIPAEWPEQRASHWGTLLRARAIENQMFVVGVNRVGESKGEHFGGGSVVVDPWGEPVVQAGATEVLLTAEIDLSLVDKVRQRISVFADRRPDVYQDQAASPVFLHVASAYPDLTLKTE